MARLSKVRTAPVMTPPPVNSPKFFSPGNIVLLGLLVIAVGVAGYFYWQYRHSPAANDKKEVTDLVTTIGTVMELPEGEQPTLATVKDKEKLQDQPFFARAENGDKVLIYSGSGRAILYRPSTKKIIEVSSVNVTAPAVNNQPSPTPPQQEESVPVIVRVAIYNGSEEAGVALALEKQFRLKYPNIAAVTKVDAVKKYDQSIVVDVTGKNADIAQALADEIHGVVGSVPTDEKAPTDADILVIAGKNR